MVATIIYLCADGFFTVLIAIKMEKTGGAGLLPCRTCPLWYCKQCQVAESNILFMYLLIFWILTYLASHWVINIMKQDQRDFSEEQREHFRDLGRHVSAFELDPSVSPQVVEDLSYGSVYGSVFEPCAPLRL